MNKLKLAIKVDSSYVSLIFVQESTNALEGAIFRLIEKTQDEVFEILNTETVDKIEKEIVGVEKESRKKVAKIYFCFPQGRIKKIIGSSQRIMHPKHSLPLGLSDIRKSIEQARLLSVDWSYRSLHSFPLGFKLNGKLFKDPPFGVYGRRLEIKVAFFACDQDYILTLDRFFERLGRPYSKLILSSLAEASSLSEKELGQGNFILLNLGRAKLELSVFRNFILEDTAVLPLAGNSIDEDVSSQLNIPINLSEEIKSSYGSLLGEDLEDGRLVTVKRVSSYREIKRGALNSILSSSYKKILEELKNDLEKKDYLRKVDFVVPLGGGADIKGFDAMIESVLGLPARRVETYLSDSVQNKSRFLAVLGALRFESSKFNPERSYRFPNSFFRRIKNLLEEYF
ncbi:MAG: hypothetical protein JW734_08060 [Candidatus Omnitrophica bacterium]|nr:hypothetical protein [Candidatus Omnitrophota bacterium]